MLRRSLVFLPPTILGLIVLFTSIVRAGSIKYEFEPTPAPIYKISLTDNYNLPSKPLITPSSPLWAGSVALERIDLALSFSEDDKAHQLIAMADKRLVSAVSLFEEGNPELGVSVVTKAEKYLEQASLLTLSPQTLQKLSQTSDTHKHVIDKLVAISPETARPILVTTSNIPQTIVSKIPTDLAASAHGSKVAF